MAIVCLAICGHCFVAMCGQNVLGHLWPLSALSLVAILSLAIDGHIPLRPLMAIFLLLAMCGHWPIYLHMYFTLTCIDQLPLPVKPLNHIAAMTQHWTTADFTKELGHLEKLAIAKPGGLAFSTMVQNYCCKLQAGQHWTSEAIVAIMEKLNQVVIPDQAKTQISDAIDQIANKANSGVRLVINGQWLESMTPYLTQKDWDTIYATNSQHAMQIICTRLRAIGLASLKEDTKKQAIAIILHALQANHKPIPNPYGILAFTQDFGDLFAKTPAKPGMHGIQRYPINPMELGQDWLTKAYGPDQMPACKIIECGFPKNLATYPHKW